MYFVDFGDLGTVTLTNDEITNISGTFSAYQYLVKGNSSFEQTFNSSRENGTTFFTQTLNLTLTKLNKGGQQRIEAACLWSALCCGARLQRQRLYDGF